MDVEIIIRIGKKTRKDDGSSYFPVLGTVQKTTLITSKVVPSVEYASDEFARAYKEALLDSARYAPIRDVLK